MPQVGSARALSANACQPKHWLNGDDESGGSAVRHYPEGHHPRSRWVTQVKWPLPTLAVGAGNVSRHWLVECRVQRAARNAVKPIAAISLPFRGWSGSAPNASSHDRLWLYYTRRFGGTHCGSAAAMAHEMPKKWNA